jgi:hypothetical protein
MARRLKVMCITFVFLAVFLAPEVSGSVDVTVLQQRDADFEVTWGQMQFNRRTGLTTMAATVRNIFPQTITGDIYLVIDSISPTTAATVSNAPDATTSGKPCFQLPAGALAPGELRTVSVDFLAPTRARFLVATHVYVRSTVLFLNPSSVVATETGTTMPIRAFLQTGATVTEVTESALLSFESSDPGVATISFGNALTFEGDGQADITATYSGAPLLTATLSVNVVPGALPEIAGFIGPAGGTIGLPDGTSVDLPTGALSTFQEIRLSDLGPSAFPALENSLVVGNTYELSPDGLALAVPATLSMKYDVSRFEPDTNPESALIEVQHSDGTVAFETGVMPGDEENHECIAQSLDTENHIVSVEISHFSIRTVTVDRQKPVAATILDSTKIQLYQLPQLRPGVRPRLNTVTEIILHSTATPRGSRFYGGILRGARENENWAHYYVDLDGTIVQVTADDQEAQHAENRNGRTIGIEIFHNLDTTQYSGRQISAVVRLCDFLLRKHTTIPRPTHTNLTGGVLCHGDIQANRSDPTHQFRTSTINNGMGLPSVENIVRRALALGPNGDCGGVINAKGGDALGLHAPGTGGDVAIEAGFSALAAPHVDSRNSLRVPLNTTRVLGAGEREWMQVIVEGTLVIPMDMVFPSGHLAVGGVFYVGPAGTIDAREGTRHADGHLLSSDGQNGHLLDVVADGFALIEGRVLVNGADKMATTEIAPFVGGSGPGSGGSGGRFRFWGAAPGPIWVPTIVTRGGDASSADDAHPIDGGDGGNVVVHAHDDIDHTPIYIYVSGRMNAPADDGHEVGLPDYMPPPGPFNQMPITTATPIASGTCHISPTATAYFLRPNANERLPLGRAIGADRLPGANVSKFQRGVISCGGMGGSLSTTTPDTAVAPSGGTGGDILVRNDTAGRIQFLDAQLFSGSGAERLAYVIFVAGGGCADFKFFSLPTGGPGGMCRLSLGKGGTGGRGGAGGNITVTGAIYPASTPVAPSLPTDQAVIGFDSDNPNFTAGTVVGRISTFPALGLTTAASGGSGGSPGGSPASFPGWFGQRWAYGFLNINGEDYPTGP